jgi:hypothetical protein
MIDTERHVHTCRVCQPGLVLTGPRLGEFHCGTRFSDGRLIYALVNGEPWGNVFEAIANHDGQRGRVWVYPHHREHDDAKMVCCRTVPIDRDLARYGRDAHPCVVVIEADVELRTRLPDETIPWTHYRV